MLSNLHITAQLKAYWLPCLQFAFLEDVVVLLGLICDNFYLGGFSGLKSTYFGQFLLLGGCFVLKALILDHFYYGRIW